MILTGKQEIAVTGISTEYKAFQNPQDNLQQDLKITYFKISILIAFCNFRKLKTQGQLLIVNIRVNIIITIVLTTQCFTDTIDQFSIAILFCKNIILCYIILKLHIKRVLTSSACISVMRFYEK